MGIQPMRIIQLFLLLVVLVAMEACTFRSHPLYQPISQGSHWNKYQGYFEYQIDSQTYLIGYSNYMPDHPVLTGTWRVRSMKSLMKGAQQYALYRAAEFTKAQGQRFFVVLHKDDWHYTGYGSKSRRAGVGLMVSPGAWAIVRIVDANVAPIQRDEARIYLADAVLESLAQENSGLAAYQGMSPLPKDEEQSNSRSFQRWRSSNGMQNAVPIPWNSDKESFGVTESADYQPGSKISYRGPGRFTVTIWDRAQISPIQVLWQCIALTSREGYKVFKIEDWAIDEPRVNAVWFRNTVEIVLQHEKEPTSLESVFEVKELLSRMDANGAPLPR
jgi:hypothetical protein